MAINIIVTFLIFIVCVQFYVKFKDDENSFVFLVSTTLITTIIGNVFIPSNISLFDILHNKTEVNKEDNKEVNKENNKIKTDLLEDEKLEYYLDQIQKEQNNGYSGGWISLSIRKKELQKKQKNEYEKIRQILDGFDELNETNKQIEDTIQQIEMNLK